MTRRYSKYGGSKGNRPTLRERDLTKVQVDEVYVIFGAKLGQHMGDKEIMTQSKLTELAQDAVDIALTRTTDPTARSSKTELSVDPTAYMATRPDHDDDGVEESEEAATVRNGSDESTGPDIETDTRAWAQVIYKAIRDPTKEDLKLRVVNVYEDPGIWIVLDGGCNSYCHGNRWAENTEMKLKKYPELEFA